MVNVMPRRYVRAPGRVVYVQGAMRVRRKSYPRSPMYRCGWSGGADRVHDRHNFPEIMATEGSGDSNFSEVVTIRCRTASILLWSCPHIWTMISAMCRLGVEPAKRRKRAHHDRPRGHPPGDGHPGCDSGPDRRRVFAPAEGQR